MSGNLTIAAVARAEGASGLEDYESRHPPPDPRKYDDPSWCDLEVSDDHGSKPDAPSARATAAIVKLPDNQRHLVLYRVACSANVKGCDRQVYQAEPSKVKIKGVMHLAGGTAIEDLDEFLDCHAQICFVVYRDYQCGDNPHPRWALAIDKFTTRLAAKFNDDLAKTFEGASAKFCVMSFTTDWRFSPARSRELVDALMAAKKDVCYLEIDAPQGHDAFLIPIPRYLQAFSNYMNRIAL